MASQNKKTSEKLSLFLWVSTGVLLMGLLFARAIFPELTWLTVVLVLPLVAVLWALVLRNQQALRSRTTAYGLNSVVTILLVIGILGVFNFFVSRYPLKLDLTKNKMHTLSDQTTKVVKGLQKSVKATFFAKSQQREQFRSLLDNYKGLNPKFEIEFVDPDREPTRSKQVGIKKYGTLQIVIGSRESKIEDITEEKITNSLIKLLKEKSPTLCVTTGHGEKNFNGQDAEGYETVKKSLADQSYEIKDLGLSQYTKDEKIPDTCDALAIVGPNKSFFEPEIKAIRNYLNEGGRAIVAVDLNMKGNEFAPELLPVLADWHVKPGMALVVDPLSRMLGVDASVAILANFSKDSPITKDFQGNCAFPLMRPLEIVPSAPTGLNVQWVAQTTPKSWGVTDMKELEKGEVKFNQGRDKAGPLTAAITIEGKQKDSKASKSTRMVVFGTSHFATNNFSRYAGNLDFFLNAVSWVLEDESLISIRAKEEGPGKVELSQKSGTFIFLLTVIAIPLVIAVSGLAIWIMRRRL